VSLHDEFGIFEPLRKDHPMVKMEVQEDGVRVIQCWICERAFCEGDRTVLAQCESCEEADSLTVECRPVHATCYLRGVQITTPVGSRIIERIRDGQTPYPFETTDGKCWSEAHVCPQRGGVSRRETDQALGISPTAADPEPPAEEPLGGATS
jgi:hypothetical protein